MLQAKIDVVLLLILLIEYISLGQPKPVAVPGAPSFGSPTVSSNKSYLCPTTLETMELEEAGRCFYPVRRGRNRTSCPIEQSIMSKEMYCLKIDDLNGVIHCDDTKVTDEGSKPIKCRCHFDPENLDLRYCHLYKYNIS
jgi:hypothetical protein